MKLLGFMLGYTIARLLYVAMVEGRHRVHPHSGSGGGGGNRPGAPSDGVGGSGGGVRIAFDDITPVVPYPS